SENVLRQENIKTASTATSIIPASTANSDCNSTVIITKKYQPEPIASELISFDISNTLQKANNLPIEPAINPQEAPKKVIDVIRAEANQLQKDKDIKPPQEASMYIYKTSQKAYNNELQHKEYQILADLLKNCMNSYLSVIKLLGHPNTCKLLNGWHPFMEKKKMMLSTAEWRKNNPPPPKKVPKTAPVAISSNSNMKKQPRAQKKGKGNAPATKPYIQGYRIPNIEQDAMEMYFRWPEQLWNCRKRRKPDANIRNDF
ncbi:hypothetical protein O181_080129, partial [Austropuccinia psidii MF-1]|nr:hypothetical protein [Austropuccinia psidii MF-1]